MILKKTHTLRPPALNSSQALLLKVEMLCFHFQHVLNPERPACINTGVKLRYVGLGWRSPDAVYVELC